MTMSNLLQVIAQEANRSKGLRAQDVFNTTLYVATGAARTVVNGIDLAGSGGFIWERYKEGGHDHSFIDSKRGVTKYILPHSTATEGTDTNYVQSFNANGYSLLNDYTAGLNVVSRTFRIAPKFLDIVAYTGSGSARTIAHSLGVAPGLMLIKRLNSTNPWRVYHRFLSLGASITLSVGSIYETNGAAVWNFTDATSSAFSLGTDASVNQSGAPYIAYIFAHDPAGVIQCGDYVGSGSSSGPAVSLGWEPQFVLIKAQNNNTSNWFTLDQAVGFSPGNDLTTRLDSTQVANPSNDVADPTSTGFTLKSAGTDYNGSGMRYMYMAIKKAS